MKEILVLSGKGGTGKTTVAASLACIVPDSVMADCDVDASDLHLLLEPEIVEEHRFVSGVKARVLPEKCTGCGTCVELCAFNAMSLSGEGHAEAGEFSCEGCGVCAWFCPEEAILLEDNRCGRWFRSETPYGPMIHAALDPGEENSGRLVALVKRETSELAKKLEKKWVVVDGPPGIGCPVIASMSGSDIILAVTEPTASGLHDLKRVRELAIHFKVPLTVCINKWDLNMAKTEEITSWCAEKGLDVAGKITFSEEVVRAVMAGKPVVNTECLASEEIRAIWKNIENSFA
jgi:MinD superfamily P-loop ATPase